VGTDDFTSLGKNEYGSTIALPIWLYYMDKVMNTLEVSNKNIPEDISFVKVNKLTGKVDSDAGDDDAYFELFLKENIN
jgi:penicillin-binding protein 1A